MRPIALAFMTCAVVAWGGCGGAGIVLEPDEVTPIDVVRPDSPTPDSSMADARVLVDAGMQDARLPPDSPPPPDVEVMVDAPPPPVDVGLGPDACVSDSICGSTSGPHCNGSGALISCVEVSQGCFHVSGGLVPCEGNQTCPTGQTYCGCAGDSRCTAGPGIYCDPSGTDSFHTCTVDSHGCVVSGDEGACVDSQICTGGAAAGSCACPALGPSEDDGCSGNEPSSCDPATGDVLACMPVGGCQVWKLSVDCASLSLGCNNNACACRTNSSHVFYVGPNYDRTSAPPGLMPTGVLTTSGVCTFPTLGAGLFAAATDVLLTNPAVTHVIAVALPGTSATFTQETFPLVIGNRTILTTMEDPDPNVGGPGFDPADYVISFNSSDQLFRSGIGVLVDPRVSSDAQATTPAAGGYAGFSGFTLVPTQANIDCPGDGATITATCSNPNIGGATTAVVVAGGEAHLGALALVGIAADAVLSTTRRLAEGPSPTQSVLESGLLLADDRILRFRKVGGARVHLGDLLAGADPRAGFDTTDAGGPWGTFDALTVSGFGNYDPTDAFIDVFGAGVTIFTQNQGTAVTGAPNRAVFSHLYVLDSFIGVLDAAGNVTVTSDGSDIPNLIAGTPHAGDGSQVTTTRIGMLFGTQDDLVVGEGATDLPIDFDGTGLFVQGADLSGVELNNAWAGSGLGTADAPFVATSVRFTGGQISGTVSGPGVLEGCGGQIFTGADLQPTPVGGLSLTTTSVVDNAADGVFVNNGQPDDLLNNLDGPSIFIASGATIDHNHGDGVHAADTSNDPTNAVSVEIDGGEISGNGTLGDSTPDGDDDMGAVTSTGNGVTITGAHLVSAGATRITSNVLAGIDAEDAIDRVGATSTVGAVQLSGTIVGGNGADQCAGNVARTSPTPISAQQAATCRSFAVIVGNTGGFSATGVQVVNNSGPGIWALAGTMDGNDTGIRCGQSQGQSKGACPLQVFSASTIGGNGGGTVRDDQAATNGVFGGPRIGVGGNTQGVLVGGGTVAGRLSEPILGRIRLAPQTPLPGALLLDQGTEVLTNAGPGVDVAGGATLYTGDVIIDGNGVNSGIVDPASPPDMAQILAAPEAGLVIQAGGAAILTGTTDNGATTSNNASFGIEIYGSLDALNGRSTGNAGHGIYVATSGAGTSTVKDVQIDHNGAGGAGDGVFIAAAVAPSTDGTPGPCIAGFTLAGDRPTLRSKTAIHDNAGNGVTVGSLDDTVQVAGICAMLGDADVFSNSGSGIVIAEPASTTGPAQTEVRVVDDDVYTNAGNGLYVGPSLVGQASPGDGGTVPATFSRNKFHSNNLNQAVFDGGSSSGDPNGTFTIDSPDGACGVNDNAFYCYTAGQTFGIFAQGNATVAVHHSQFQDDAGMNGVSAQTGSSITVDTPCAAMTVCP